MPKDPARWIEAPEVKDIADRLIPRDLPKLADFVRRAAEAGVFP